MTDCELLELAAKAAGKTNWQSRVRYIDARCDSEGVPYWNPLRDDGDALRLAVKLRMDVDVNESDAMTTAFALGAMQGHSCDFMDDPQAATRRAIVRAAAEIGKALTATPTAGREDSNPLESGGIRPTTTTKG